MSIQTEHTLMELPRLANKPVLAASGIDASAADQAKHE